MYSGSMVGSGAMVFAVWGYVIANMMPSKNSDGTNGGSVVELNPRILGPILGESVEDVRKAIDKLCSPDAESRSKEDEGRRMRYLGAFLYRVTNGDYYRAIRDEATRRAQVRDAMRRHRAVKMPKRGKPLPGAALYEAAIQRDDGSHEAVLAAMEQKDADRAREASPFQHDKCDICGERHGPHGGVCG